MKSLRRNAQVLALPLVVASLLASFSHPRECAALADRSALIADGTVPAACCCDDSCNGACCEVCCCGQPNDEPRPVSSPVREGRDDRVAAQAVQVQVYVVNVSQGQRLAAGQFSLAAGDSLASPSLQAQHVRIQT